jgi:hypothetical protein
LYEDIFLAKNDKKKLGPGTFEASVALNTLTVEGLGTTSKSKLLPVPVMLVRVDQFLAIFTLSKCYKVDSFDFKVVPKPSKCV